MIYLSTGNDKNGYGLIGVISSGSPKFGDTEIKILDVGRFETKHDAEKWFEKMLIEKPWEVK